MYINNKMKFYMQVLVLLVLSSVAISRVTPRNKFEEGLLRVLEKCKVGDVESLPAAFPSLKTLKMPFMKMNHRGFTMTLREVKIKGLENLTVRKLSASPSDMTMSLEIFIPALAVRAERYHLQGRALLIFRIDDKGVMKTKINNLKARAHVQFGAKGKDTVITGLNLDYSIDDIRAHLSGSNNLVNQRFNDQVSELINNGQMKGRIQNLIINIAREYLRGHTPQEFVDIISTV